MQIEPEPMWISQARRPEAAAVLTGHERLHPHHGGSGHGGLPADASRQRQQDSETAQNEATVPDKPRASSHVGSKRASIW